jgi:RHS repeat-associated protein
MGVNGVASYAYDKVSNRISRTPSIAGVVNQSLAFNDNDQIDGSGYAYDDNGSTTQAPDGSADVYSFDNMLIRRVNTTQGLTVDMVYSATGDRVSKTTNGVTTNYLVDTNNHTGYAQVVEETDAAGNLEAVMVYGHDLISQDRTDGAGGFEMSFYSYDGLGSVRGLTDSIGTSLGQYHYDAYGTKIEDTVTVANPYLFAGERFDNDLGLYYLRARYLDVETGRFWSLDDFEGNNSDPQSLHKYLYAHANPISINPAIKKDRLSATITLYLIGIPENCCATI